MPAINLAVNSAKHRTTDFSPAFLFTGRSARLQRQLIFGEHEQEDRTREDYAVEVAERMKKVYKVVKENVAKHLEYRKKEYLEDDARDFKEGGTVLIFMPQTKKGKAPKLTPGWSYPFKIIRKITPAVYELEALNWSQEPIRVIRGLSHLKLYQGETDFRDKTRRYEATDFQEAHDFDTEP